MFRCSRQLANPVVSDQQRAGATNTPIGFDELVLATFGDRLHLRWHMKPQPSAAAMTSPGTGPQLAEAFALGLPYERYVASGSPDQQAAWARFLASAREHAALTPAQETLVKGFTRRVNVLVLSGTWCGDCVQQCPLLHMIAEVNPARGPAGRGLAQAAAGAIDLRFADRDEHADLAERFMICGGRRVPTAIFMNEDFEFVALMGDKTLARFRAIAARSLGAACPLPGAPVPADEIAATLRDWLDEFERVHLLLRTSAKLRQRHGD